MASAAVEVVGAETLGRVHVSARASRSLVAIVLLLLVGAIHPASGVAQTVRPDGATLPSGVGTASRVPGEILVKFRDAADADDIDSQGTHLVRPQARARRPAGSPRAAGRTKLFPRTTYRRLNRLVKMSSARLRREPQRLHEVLAALRARPEVEYAEPNVTLQALWVPNDPYFGSSGAWGQAFGDLWGLQKIVASLAWDRSKGAGVVVAVLDTGVDARTPTWPPTCGRAPARRASTGSGSDKRTNGVDDDGNGFVDDWRGWDFTWPGGGYNAPIDYHGHGTHVAGTIAAVGNNAVGVVGVAPLARIMPVKVLDSGGSGTLEEISTGILYAANNGARVINASLGGLGETPQTLVDAIAYAHDVKGVVFVAAAGNSNQDVGPAWTGFFPANIRDAIAVAAFDHVDQKASFSNFGAKIDVAAPGGGDTDASGTIYEAHRSILSLKAAYAGSSMTGSGQLVVDGQYLRQAGTSMAAPARGGRRGARPRAPPRVLARAGAAGDPPAEPTTSGLPASTPSSAGGASTRTARPAGRLLLGVQLSDPARPFPAAVPPSVRGSAAGPGLLDWTLAFGSGSYPRRPGPRSPPAAPESRTARSPCGRRPAWSTAATRCA